MNRYFVLLFLLLSSAGLVIKKLNTTFSDDTGFSASTEKKVAFI